MSMCGDCGEHRSTCICAMVRGSAEVARLNKRIEVLEMEVFKLHEIAHTYYSGCRCATCESHRRRIEMRENACTVNDPLGERREG